MEAAGKPARRRQMKLFVWNGVLADYSSGMIVALAPSLSDAVNLAGSLTEREEMTSVTPEVTDVGLVAGDARIWLMHGGG
jgi:hypothetical protein